ncbi:MAG: hypothetical protein JRE70_13075, partial [Deltaproteobacteria bacterium]|nr:hypothetical protein [Deltaproteobacteria bacterium]
MKAAGIGGHTPYDLRKTYASVLFSLHVPERYVLRQMGHADFATTTKHYAKYIADEDDMGISPKLARGECWADLIAKFESQGSHKVSKSA